MSTPDFPKEQVALFLAAVAGVCADLSVNVPPNLQTHVLTLVTVAYPLVALGLAHIRASRAKALAAKHAADAHLAAAALVAKAADPAKRSHKAKAAS